MDETSKNPGNEMDSEKDISIERDVPIISLSDGEDLPSALSKPGSIYSRLDNVETTENELLCSYAQPDEIGVSAFSKAGNKRSSIDSVETIENEQRFRLKRRKIKVAGAPKMPLTGYVRYMNDRREILRKELPTKTAIEHTKIIGEEWHQLAEERKAPYMKAAELDKQRYLDELHSFLKARPDVLACELAKNKVRKNPASVSMDVGKSILKEKTPALQQKEQKYSSSTEMDVSTSTTQQIKRKRTPTPTNLSNNIPTPLSASMPGEIPIFTNEFLEHNKVFDMELRTLRKSKADLEQQNAVLEKHVENMKFGVEKMTNENDELEEKNRLLEIYLDKLKQKLANALASLALPTEPKGASMDNINKYMNDLYKMATSNTHGPASLNKAKDIIRKLDLQIQL